MDNERLDKLLVTGGYVSSRERAKKLIAEGHVLVDGIVIQKPGRLIPHDCSIELLKEEIPWVSRGALKLLAALERFEVNPHEKICLDLGASTGGFTEVLLEKGAKKVYCVDVGTDQLVDKIKQNPRVVSLEKTHVNQLNSTLIPEAIDLCVIDVSFISLTKVLPFIVPLLKPSSELIALVKPQFEVGPSNLNKKGIVKDPNLYSQVKNNVVSSAKTSGLSKLQEMESPLKGGDGNQEFLMLFRLLSAT